MCTFQVPLLVPGLSYIFETLLRCLNDKGISDIIKVNDTWRYLIQISDFSV